MRRLISTLIVVAFISVSIKSPVYAQETPDDPMPILPIPGKMVHLSPQYTPAYLKGIVVHPDNALKFDFIVFKGDKELTDQQKREEYTKLTKYFLASLAIPDEDQWVNLSPYEKDRIIKDDFGKTEMGRDLLAQDYMLKQITASLIYPEDNLGRKFWTRVYSEAQLEFGTTNVPVNTYNKVWILPDDALIYEKGNTAYVLRNHLRVMLEQDYLSLAKHAGIASGVISNVANKSLNALGSKIVRQIILPELEKEINTGKNFANLRQVYSGMLLATWYKRALKESLLSRIYANKAKVKGVDQDPKNNEEIYKRYLSAYKKGVFNFIKEDVDKYTNETIPRKYFSGGEVDYAQASEKLGYNPVKIVNSLSRTQLLAVQGGFKNNEYDYAQLAAQEESEVIAPGLSSNPVINRDAAMNGEREESASADNRNPVQQKIEMELEKVSQEGRPLNILAVCTGNVNRSALFDMILQQRIRDLGIGDRVKVQSGGTLQWQDKTVESRITKIFNGMLTEYLKSNPPNISAKRLNQLFKIIAGIPLDGNLNPDAIGFSLLSFDRNNYKNIINITEPEIEALSSISQETIKRVGKKFALGPSDKISIAAKLAGIDTDIVDGFNPKMLTPDQVRNADLIFVADSTHAEFINTYFPKARDKVFLVKALSGETQFFRLALEDPQKEQISEEGAVKLIGGLIDRYLMPLLIDFSKSQSSGVAILPSTALSIREEGKAVSQIKISWGNSQYKIQVRPLIKELGTLWVFEVYLEGRQVSFFSQNVLEDGLPIKPGQELEFGIKVRRTGGEGGLIIRSEGKVFSLGWAFNTKGQQVPAYIDTTSKTESLIGKLTRILNQKIIIKRRLSNHGGGVLDIQNLTHTSAIVINDGINPPKKIGIGMQERYIFAQEGNKSDPAAVSKVLRSPDFIRGGIDFNAANLKLQIKRDGHGVPLPISRQDLENIHIDGLVPVILGIKPALETSLLSQLENNPAK